MYFHHVIWHFFVLAGAACHFLAVVWYVLPVQPGVPAG
jgi:hemolysin III